MKNISRVFFLPTLLLALTLGAFAGGGTPFGDLVYKFVGDGNFNLEFIDGEGEATCNIEISESASATLVIKPAPKVKGLLKPYHFNIECGASKLKRLVVDLGSYQTGAVLLTAKDIGNITTKSADLRIISEGKKISRINADPGLSEALCPDAKVGFILVTKYVGNVDDADRSRHEPMPSSCIFFDRVQKIKTLHYNKYKKHWISQIECNEIGTIRASSISHLRVARKITALRTYNLTGHIIVGCEEDEERGDTNESEGSYSKGKINKIFCANIYSCIIRAGVPDLQDSLDEYYNSVPALGIIKKMRAGSVVDSIIVSKRKIKIPGKRFRPYYGNDVEIWENCKQRNLKLNPGK